jgi:hypothetical protein
MLLFKIAVINKNVYDIFTDTNILIKLTKFCLILISENYQN